VSFKRKLLAGTAVLLLAGGATGAAIAASGQGRSLPPAPHQLRLASTSSAGFLKATAQYLGTEVATLRHETKGGTTLAEIANRTSGRSARQLTGLLLAAATAKLQQVADRALSTAQTGALRRMVRPRIVGFLNDTCPLALGSFAKHLGGCPGMGMHA
jgi:hypothetical protein